ncbi:MAG: hypothetical protein ACJ8R9_31150 [Steroidobacteraceae bacterium]
MSILRFNDGIEIDTSGNYRTLELHGGWYVVGHGTLQPCADREEAIQVRDELIATLKSPQNAEAAEDSKPKFPHVRVQLSGEDGNVFSIIGRVQRALREGGASDRDIDAFWEQVSNAGSYDEALVTIRRWVDVS